MNIEQGALVPLPSAAAAVVPVTAQTLVGEWIDHCDGGRPPGRVVGQVAKQLAEMLTEGVDPDLLRRGLAAWASKGLHPSTLPSVVHEVMNGQSRLSPRQQATDAMFDRAMQRARRRGGTGP